MAVSSLGKALCRIPGAQCMRSFCCNERNKLSRFVGRAKNLDKSLKAAKTVADLTADVLNLTGESPDVAMTARNISAGVGTTRSFIALANVFNGVIPGMVSSVRKCCDRIRKLGISSQDQETSTDHLVAIAQEGCNLVSGATYTAVFGGIRPALLANKLASRPFLNSCQKAQLGDSVTYLMTANHAAGVLGGALGIFAEQRAYERQSRQLEEDLKSISPNGEKSSPFCERVAERWRMRKQESHLARLKRLILSTFEKFFDLLGDIIKLIPLGVSAGVQAIIGGVCALVSASIGLYSAWANS